MSFEDDTNTPHSFQGKIRFAPLDKNLRSRITQDADGTPHKLVMTHCDQLAAPCDADWYCFGPTRNDLKQQSIVEVQLETLHKP